MECEFHDAPIRMRMTQSNFPTHKKKTTLKKQFKRNALKKNTSRDIELNRHQNITPHYVTSIETGAGEDSELADQKIQSRIEWRHIAAPKKLHPNHCMCGTYIMSVSDHIFN